ncbi:hypothetical protein FA15DRAFT_663629 [Coprinopsis marcescibilis]|uniref:PWWP domain-containing protein n=1 Tax=Coprinopsis marcescibilis TaxID=230819 RepID=A0A5C3LE81_COPMA|nr:hypothetical protein FA15DRAFT_663629 [Coprinopsis marcescibilis]
MADASSGGSAIIKRGAALQARKILMEYSTDSEEESTVGAKKRKRGRPRKESTVGAVGAVQKRASSAKRVKPSKTLEELVVGESSTTLSATPARKRGRPKKKTSIDELMLSTGLSLLDGEESDLTPLSSPVLTLKKLAQLPHESPQVSPKAAVKNHPMFPAASSGDLQASDTLDPMSPTPQEPSPKKKSKSPSKALKEPPPTKPQPKYRPKEHPMFATTSKSDSDTLIPITNQSTKDPGGDSNEPWELESLGRFVWVLLNGKNGKTPEVFDPITDAASSKDRIWWPGVVKDTIIIAPVGVRLFGETPRVVLIENPCAENVLSYQSPHSSKRFSSYEAARHRSSGRSASPRKRQKVADPDKNAWENACRLMEDAIEFEAYTDADAEDDLPEIADVLTAPLLSAKAKVKPSEKKKPRQKPKEASVELDDGSDWSDFDLAAPPSADSNLSIPGELVLARVFKKSLTEYWPAKLKEYIPPQGRNKVARYKVQFFDGIEDEIPRSYFYTQEEEGFGICKMGLINSLVKDDTNDDENVKHVDMSFMRIPSPEPATKLPSTNKFVTLNTRQQFAYTKPVLKAILMNEYGPVKQKQETFMRGGKARAEVTKHSTSRGLMASDHIDQLSQYVVYWCLREKMHVKTDAYNGEEELPVVGGEGGVGDSVMDEPPGFNNLVLSPAATELVLLPSSPVPEPPSSSFTPLSAQDDANLVDSPAANLLQLATQAIEFLTSSDVAISNPDTISAELELPEPRPLDVEVQTFPKQTGSPDYERLSDVEKLDFCTNILLPETIRQVLLWRNGDRKSFELMSDEEEQQLYDRGQVYVDQRDWVCDVIRLRDRKNKLFFENVKDPRSGLERTVSARTGRIRKTINYQE